MRSIRLLSLTVALAVMAGLISCSRDPAVVKKRYYESGNKYFDKGLYKPASIQYRNALKQDPKWGPAHYKLGLTYAQLHDVAQTVNSFRRAYDTLPKDSPEYYDCMVRLAEIYLQAGRGEPQLIKEIEDFTKKLLDRDPKSFDGHRLVGDLHYSLATKEFKEKHPEEGMKELDLAVEEYRRAEQTKPGQPGVS